MKKIISLMLAFSILFVTAACTKQADAQTNQTETESSESTIAETQYTDTLPQSDFEGQTYVIAGMVDNYKLTEYTELNYNF